MSDSSSTRVGSGSSKPSSPLHKDEYTPSKTRKPDKDDQKCRRRIGFAGLCLAVVVSSAVFSLLAPFYPDVAANNGLSDSTIGFIFAIFALMVMLVSPYLGVKMGEIGSKKMMIYGLGLLSVSTVAFSLLDSIDAVHSTFFLVISVLLRILQGIGAAGSETASYALAAQLYPDDLSYAVGVMETLCSFGYMIGPPLGGVLYQLGGFSTPFLVVGLVALITTFALRFMFPDLNDGDGEDEEEEAHTLGDLLQTMRNPGIAIVACMAVVANGSYALLEPTLEPFVEETFEDFNQAEVGLLFFLISMVYAAACPLSGWAASRNKALKLGPEFVMLVGMLIIALAMFLLGPSPLLPIPPSMLSLTVIALMLLGLGQSMASVPNMDSMLGFCDNSQSTKNVNAISGILNAAYSLGGIVGPLMGSMLTTSIGFPWATTIWGFVIIAQCVLMVATLRSKKKRLGANGMSSKVARSVELMTAAEAIDGVFAQAKAEDGTFGQSSDSESDS